tara:strand:- start:137 stop:754 length:618 start_codon:yes stop_codon:yes gene_type:complete
MENKEANKDTDTNYFKENIKTDITNLIDTKYSNVRYLSWDRTYKLAKLRDLNFNFKYHEDPNGRPYFVDGERIWAKVSTTMCGHTHTEIFPFMEGMNNIAASKVSNSVLNKQLKRALCKAIALHGIALDLWTGEDLPDDSETSSNQNTQQANMPVTEGQLKTLRNNTEFMTAEQITKAKNNTLTKKEASDIISSFPWAKNKGNKK